MDIREVDLDDDDLMHQLAGISERVGCHERPHAPAFSETAHTGWLRSTDTGERRVVVAAQEGDRVLGSGALFLPLHDNLDLAFLDVQVDVAHRRRGIGTALLDHLVGLATAAGRTTLLAETTAPFERVEDHPDRRFAERRGFTLGNIEVVRHQALPVSEGDLDAWQARASERAADYRIETHVNEFPDELAPSLCTLLGQLGVDAPTGAVDFEEEVITPERLAERYPMAEAMGRDVFETVALTPDGVVAAQTTLSVPHREPDAFQWGTFTHREHRGHSLGLAVKVANLRAAQAAHPHLRRVVTQNAETNQWMIAVNELMGYRRVEATVELVRRC